ncbi:MAG: FMN-binding glutamate synthase family protein, partial [bacterium]|nr:FMN-binding glutamate synthase family protein [bacterium]
MRRRGPRHRRQFLQILRSPTLTIWILLTLAFLLLVTVYDLIQRKHAILRNFPIIGHLRYILESVGPELRQYIVTNNDEERPFSRDQRTWVYASAKRQNNYFGFGTDNKIELAPSYLIIKHSAFPLDDPHPGQPDYDPAYRIPCGKVLGGWRSRPGAFRPESVINVSAMSFGSLSAAAVEAINRGCALAGCLHNTGEGGVAPHHQHRGDLIWQIGTGYFGCRASDGGFDLATFLET